VTTPNSAKGRRGEDLGKLGMELHERMDQFSRKILTSSLKKSGIPTTKIDVLLDPINEIGIPAQRDPFNPSICYSSYVPEGYLSSSVLATTHESSVSNSEPARTHGGILTVAIISDVPGLEVFDQELGQWIAIEQLVHDLYAPRVNKYHHQFAIVFWGRSVSYLKGAPGFQPCVFRERKREKERERERYSVQFKQRATPLTTPCQGRNDQIILDVQMNAIKHVKWVVPGVHPPSPPSPSLSLFSTLSSPQHPLLIAGALFLFGSLVGIMVTKRK